MNKAIIFDSSTLISFAMNGILDILRELKKVFKGNFLITADVKREVIDKPLTIPRFKLEALKIQELLTEKVLEMPKDIGISGERISKRTTEILNKANGLFEQRGKDIKIVSSGEISCLALSELLSEKKIENVIAIDERTTRMLVENPKKLKNFLEKKMHTRISPKKSHFEYFGNFKIIRSAELVYIAYKKKITKIGDGKLLDALLWAVKFKGCSITDDEIKEIKKLS